MSTTPITWKSGLRAGILGDGQLARMLSEAGSALGLRCHSFGGKLSEEAAVREFFGQIDFAVIENEFVPTQLLEKARGQVPVLPVPSALTEMRDKLHQKELLTRLQIPTAPFLVYDGSPLTEWIAKSSSKFGGSCVFKWGQMGYDGKGVLLMKNHAAEKDAVFLFCQGAMKAGVSLFAEAKVTFKRELAQLAVFSTTGESAFYPLVVTEQMGGVCVWVSGPATGLGVSPDAETPAREYAKKIAEITGLVGVFALELFELPTGEIWVNEIAPRVHNSGHFTQNGARTSQFENHWRAVLGLPLGMTDTAPCFVMRNLLGPEGVTQTTGAVPLPQPEADIAIHWYDKTLRPGRKVGHLSAVGAGMEELALLRYRMESCHGRWVEAVRTYKGGR